MNPVELTYNSWHRQFYEFWWVKTAPTNFCNYTWGLLLALLTIPFFLGRCVYEFAKECPESSGVVFKTVAYIFSSVTVCFIGYGLGYGIVHILVYPIVAVKILGMLLGFIGTIALAVAGGYFFTSSEIMHMTTSRIKAKKEKVCPPIDWKK